jgi:hypothetical protein
MEIESRPVVMKGGNFQRKNQDRKRGFYVNEGGTLQ